MPDTVVRHLNDLAARDGMTRAGFAARKTNEPRADQPDPTPAIAEHLPAMIPVGGVPGAVLPADDYQPAAGVIHSDAGEEEARRSISDEIQDIATDLGGVAHRTRARTAMQDAMDALDVPVTIVPPEPAASSAGSPVRRTALFSPRGSAARDPALTYLMLNSADQDLAAFRRQLAGTSHWVDKCFALKVSVKRAIRERGPAATQVIEAELQQMVDKGVWHGIHPRNLSRAKRAAIIRSSMFLKDKFLASGGFDKYKARLVAGGDGQDRGLYEDLASPTVATSSVLISAAIDANEGREVRTGDIGGAFLNADMSNTGVPVYMRLDKLMTSILVKIDPTFAEFVLDDGSSVVQLDKALYGTVEAAKLWYDNLCGKLLACGFTANPYDACVFNKTGESGNQLTICLHVDDLKFSSVSSSDLDDFEAYMESCYDNITWRRGKVLDYVGMTFDYRTPGEVRVTMDNATDSILEGCGVDTPRATPAASTLFETRDTVKLAGGEYTFYRSYVPKILYLAKRVRPECLTAVAFLTTRAQAPDIDDMAKLKRLLGYLLGARHRGIVLRVGDYMQVKAFIDASYGVHPESGKSHTGCMIAIGDVGPIYVKSSKQKIVSKSSTEAELIALSDTASQAVHIGNFIKAQGYSVGPVVLYQDNMSCMALMKRGSPGSERSRHINIRHFWVKERVDNKEVIIEHLGTDKMWANALTKPVQGKQFIVERLGLTGWE
jgi:hypothetical protein